MEWMEADPISFRKAMSVFGTGVAIAVVRHPLAGPIGVTVNSLVSVSLSPLLALFCLGRDSQAWPYFDQASMAKSQVSVSILTDEQKGISSAFTHCLPGTLEAEHGQDFYLGPDHPPTLKESAASLLGRFQTCFSGGDHDIYLWEVQSVTYHLQKRPLLYHHSQYKAVGTAV